MRKLMLMTAAMALGAAAPAFAYTNTPTGPDMQGAYPGHGGTYAGQPGYQGGSSAMQGRHFALRQRIRQELEQAGFTDIRITPESFLVQARDPQGQPFFMILNPNSVTAVTAVPNRSNSYGRNGNGGNGYGQNEQYGPMGGSAMTNSGHAGNAINSPNGNGTYER